MTRELNKDDLRRISGGGGVKLDLNGKQPKPIGDPPPQPPISNPVEPDEPTAGPGSGDNVDLGN